MNGSVRRVVTRTRTLVPDHLALIVGIVNATPDSFSGDGVGDDTDATIAHALRLVEAGADLIDVGGESTRPGADPVPVEVELARVVPVVEALAERGVPVSVDTSKPEVANAALEAGAEVVNDVTALASPGMAELVAGARCGVVLMHMQGTPRTMQLQPQYDDVVAEVESFLLSRADAAIEQGVDPDRIVIDPGIGFGKTLDHNLALLAAVPRLASHGFPVLIGHSRKRFIGTLTGVEEPAGRDAATAVLSGFVAANGAAAVRVHDPETTKVALRMATAIVRPPSPPERCS